MKSTVYKPFRHIFGLFRVFGLAPFGENANQNVILQLVSLVSLLIACLILCSALFVTGFIHQNSSQTMVDGLIFTAEIIVNIIVIVQSYTMRQQQAQILENIDAAQQLITTSIRGEERIKRSVRKHLVKMNLLLFTMLASIIIEMTVLWINFNGIFLNYLLQYMYSTYANRVRCIQNVFYVDLMREQLHCIAQSLHDMVERQTHGCVKQFSVGSMLLYPLPIEIDTKSEIWLAKHKDYTDLLSLKVAYGKLWDTSCLINDCFGWSLLAIFTQYFVHLTVHCYWLFLTLNHVLPMPQMYESVNDICIVLIVLIVLCQACYASGEQATDIVTLISKCGRTPCAEGYLELVREFELQLGHEPIVITANGFFNIDRDLLASLGATTLTYLVILIQFQNNESSRPDDK